MPRAPKGAVAKRLRHHAIKTLAATIADESQPAYVRAFAARTLLQVERPEPSAEVVEKPSIRIVLPDNGRERDFDFAIDNVTISFVRRKAAPPIEPPPVEAENLTVGEPAPTKPSERSVRFRKQTAYLAARAAERRALRESR